MLMLAPRYAFDAIGELFFGQMFGFMQNREDHRSYIASLDTLMPVMCTVAVAPTYARTMILMSSIVNPVVRRGLRAVGHIAGAAKACVLQRVDRNTSIESGEALPRRDMLQQLLDLIGKEKRTNIDYDIPEVQAEAHTSLYVSPHPYILHLRSQNPGSPVPTPPQSPSAPYSTTSSKRPQHTPNSSAKSMRPRTPAPSAPHPNTPNPCNSPSSQRASKRHSGCTPPSG